VPAGDQDEGREQVADLVERFVANEAHYRSTEFDETSTREQFINGFFDALGWDVLDAAGRGGDRDVIFHPRLRDEREIAGEEEWDEDLSEDELAERQPVARVPDYAFRYEGATRFFVEAKRAGTSLDTRAACRVGMRAVRAAKAGAAALRARRAARAAAKLRSLDNILRDDKLFRRFVMRRFPVDQPYSIRDSQKIWDKLVEERYQPRLDPGHPSRTWNVPHINVIVDGRAVHIPVDPGFRP
jgi:hypothetical protein